MIVKSNSWHCRLFNLMRPKDERGWRSVTFCNYWSSIVFSPLFFVFAAFAICVIFPFAWTADKLEERFKGKTICPMGKVERE